MQRYVWRIIAHLQDSLEDWICEYFSGLSIVQNKDGSCVLTGKMSDMSAVYGLLLKIRDTDISLLSLWVEREISNSHL